jgi:hypothetical protein
MLRSAPLVGLAVEVLLLSGLAVHAHSQRVRRAEDERAIATVSRLMPAADLSLAGAARHLRFPSLEEPAAAFADYPGSPDTDPAGGALAPPTDVYIAIGAPSPGKRSPQPLGQGPSLGTPK